MAENNQEKTEAPTPRRRQEAREEGNVARSMDLTAAAVVIAGIVAVGIFGEGMMRAMAQTAAVVLSGHDMPHDGKLDMQMITTLAYHTILVSAPVPILCGFAGLFVALLQVGPLMTTKPLVPNIAKLNPLKGLKNMLGLRGFVRLLMSLCKVIVIVTAASVVIRIEAKRILFLEQLDILHVTHAMAELILVMAIVLGLALIILALIDYAYQRWQHEQDLRMSKQDVKEEAKRMDGDPQIKQRRARIARQMAMQRMALAVPNADVVVTNPTHLAIALKYDRETMRAPKVVAKGADLMASRIRQIAQRHGVPLIERKPLARAMYYAVEVGQEIAPEFYTAVAEVLAHIYRLGDKVAA